MWSNIINFWNKESPFNIPLWAHALLQKQRTSWGFPMTARAVSAFTLLVWLQIAQFITCVKSPAPTIMKSFRLHKDAVNWPKASVILVVAAVATTINWKQAPCHHTTMCSVVRWQLSAALTSALALTRNDVISTWPRDAASINGVLHHRPVKHGNIIYSSHGTAHKRHRPVKHGNIIYSSHGTAHKHTHHTALLTNTYSYYYLDNVYTVLFKKDPMSCLTAWNCKI